MEGMTPIMQSKTGVIHFSFLYDTGMFILVHEDTPSKVHIYDHEDVIDLVDFNYSIQTLVHLKEFVAVCSSQRIVLYNLTLR
jgi:hypothetical protein